MKRKKPEENTDTLNSDKVNPNNTTKKQKTEENNQVADLGNLFKSVINGNLPFIEKILEQNINLINFIDPEYKATPLHEAAKHGHLEVINLLLDKGAKVNAEDTSGETPLHEAAANGRLEVVNLLLDKGANVNAEDTSGSTPLHNAALYGRLEVVNLLLDKKAKINAEGQDKATPLHEAARFGRLEVVNLLLNKGAKVNAEDADKATPLHEAVANGRLEVVNLLLNKGANINAENASGDTPLHEAAMINFLEVVKLFLLSQNNLKIFTKSNYKSNINDLINIYNDIEKIVKNRDSDSTAYNYVKSDDMEFATKCFLSMLKSIKVTNQAAIDNILNNTLLNQSKNINLKIALINAFKEAKKDAIDYLKVIEDEIINQFFVGKKSQLSIFFDKKAELLENKANVMLQDDSNKLSVDEDALINSLIEIFSVKEHGYNFIAKNMALVNYNIANLKEEDMSVAAKAMKLMVDNILGLENLFVPHSKFCFALDNMLQEYVKLSGDDHLCYIFRLESENAALKDQLDKQQEQVNKIEKFLENLGFSNNQPVEHSQDDLHNPNHKHDTSLVGDTL